MKLNDMMVLLFVFFLASTGMFLLFANIGVTNSGLDEESRQDLVNLNIYQANNSNPFATSSGKIKNINYSLTAYSNTGDFEQSNIETKGALESILDIFGGSGLSAFSSPLTLLLNLSPLPDLAFSWATNMVLGFIGILVFVAGIAAWKAGAWG